MRKGIAGVVVVLVAGGLSAALYSRSASSGEPPFKTVAVTRGPVVEKALAVGAIGPKQEIAVKSKIPGIVKTSYREVGDVIRSGAATVQRLSEIFRQAERSLIIDVAHEINAGTVPDPPEARKEDLRDFYFVVRPGVEECAASVEELVCDRIPARFGMDPFTDIQVLAPMHRGDIGVKALNARLQQVLNGQGDELVHGGGVYRQGDRVMQLRNDYDKEVFNGDVGRILSIDRANRALKVRFDGRIVGYEAGELDQLTLAYAVSVHKSQGSEYPAVVIPLLTQHYMMLQRNLLYTAITRGRRLVILVGSHRALRIAVGNNRVMKRCTRLPERIQEAMTAR